jgi:glycosyltransferase involved in cell wall biosynthesis
MPQAAAMMRFAQAKWVYTEHSPGAIRQSPRFRLFYRVFGERFDAFVAIAPEMHEAMRSLGARPDRIVDIPHGVRIPVRADPRRRAPHTTLGFVGRLEPDKRIDRFFDILECLPNPERCSVLIVGDGSLRSYAEIRARGVDMKVEFAGFVSDVTPLLDCIDVLLMTSDDEPFGLVALEAMARRAAVVATPVRGGLKSLVEQGGMILSSSEAHAAALELEAFLGDTERQRRIEESGMELARARTFNAVSTRLDDLYDETLAGIPRRHVA